MKFILLSAILMFFSITAYSQDDGFQRHAGYLSFRNDLNLDDYHLGTEIGLINRSRDLSTFVTFDARPYRKKILEYQGNNRFYQFTEERYFLGVGAEYFRSFKRYPLGAFAQVNAAYTWGVYGGTEHKPDHGWVLIPRLGLALDLRGSGLVKLGYSYFDSKSYRLEKHRVFIAISGFLTRE